MVSACIALFDLMSLSRSVYVLDCLSLSTFLNSNFQEHKSDWHSSYFPSQLQYGWASWMASLGEVPSAGPMGPAAEAGHRVPYLATLAGEWLAWHWFKESETDTELIWPVQSAEGTGAEGTASYSCISHASAVLHIGWINGYIHAWTYEHVKLMKQKQVLLKRQLL